MHVKLFCRGTYKTDYYVGMTDWHAWRAFWHKQTYFNELQTKTSYALKYLIKVSVYKERKYIFPCKCTWKITNSSDLGRRIGKKSIIRVNVNRGSNKEILSLTRSCKYLKWNTSDETDNAQKLNCFSNNGPPDVKGCSKLKLISALKVQENL